MYLHPIDLAVIAVYLVGITLFGVALGGRKSKGDAKTPGRISTVGDYFLAGGSLPWWAIAFSIVAAETSVLTIISTPGLAYDGNLGFLQLVFGYLVARILICIILLPAYFRGRMTTAYELIRNRFGERARNVAAAIFLIGRSLAEGVRFFAMAIVLQVVLESLPPGWHLNLGAAPVLAILAVMVLVYTWQGGLRAVVWTDFIQICIYVAGAILSLVLVVRAQPGGWHDIAAVAAVHGGKLRIFDFSTTQLWSRTYTFWSGLVGGTFLAMATHGTDQLMVQRLLSARSLRESRHALLSSWLVVFLQFALFLLIGVGLFAFYLTHPLPSASGTIGNYDRLYPQFVARNFPAGVAGLALAAIIAAAMSNLSAALNALSSSTILDLYRPHIAPGRSEAHYLRASRLATLGWVVVLALVAFAARRSHSVLELGLAILAYPFSAMLGLFLLGTLTRRANQTGAITGMAVGIAGTLWLSSRGVAYTWFAVAGTFVTFVVGYGVSILAARFPARARS